MDRIRKHSEVHIQSVKATPSKMNTDRADYQCQCQSARSIKHNLTSRTMIGQRRLLADGVRNRLLWQQQPVCRFFQSTASLWDNSRSSKDQQHHHDIIPGGRHKYGSLGEMPSPHSNKAVPWQASHNQDIQNVTQKALIYELTQQQTRTIEAVVPWFLENMPPSYFDQIPEPFRMDHIKAIAAIKDANMDLYLNLKSHMPDGREGTYKVLLVVLV